MSDTDPKIRNEPITEEFSSEPGPHDPGQDQGLNGPDRNPDNQSGSSVDPSEAQGQGQAWNSLSEAEKVSRIMEAVQRITPENENPVEHLESLVSERDRYKDQMMRAAADLENYKKKSIRERSETLKYRNEDLLRALLPVMDNMDRALSHCKTDEEQDPFVEGVCMIADMLKKTLDQFGAQPIDALGKEFDPSVHDALAQVPTADHPPNQVIEEMEKGYMYNDRLLRPSKVVVSTKPESQ